MVEATKTTKKLEPMWRCQVKDCNYSTPPTLHGHNQMTGHLLHHAKEGLPKEERIFRLVDQNTGTVLAEGIKEAREKGLLELEKPQPSTPKPTEEPSEELKEGAELGEELSEEPPKVKEKAEKEGKEVKEISSDGIFRYTVTLPADAFTLFNIAKAYGLEQDGKIFDEFIWDCIVARFEKDYKKQLILAPIEGEE